MRKNNQAIIKRLIENICQEISSLEEIYLQIKPLLEKIEKISEEEKTFYIRAAGSIIHDFYTGVEKIFCDIANKIDKGLPKHKDWHMQLLKSMTKSRLKRPQVISLELGEDLKEYLGFRHLFRNIYGTQLDWDRLKTLLIKIQDSLWKRLKEELESFIKKMTTQRG